MPSRACYTSLGLVALGFWATSVALTRGVTESLGPYTTLALNFGGAGLLLLVGEGIRHRDAVAPLRLPLAYLLGCGAIFVFYCVGYVVGLGLGTDRQAALQLGVVNYLWPALTLVLAIFLCGYRARWILLAPGLAFGVSGVVLAMMSAPSFAAIRDGLARNRLAFLLVLGAAFSWALYSDLSRRWGAQAKSSGVPLFMLAAGAVGLVLRFATHETSTWSGAVALQLAYSLVFPTATSYLLWDLAVRKGNLPLLGAASYLLPIASTAFAGWFLAEPLGWNLLGGCVLVSIGAVLCKVGVEEGSVR